MVTSDWASDGVGSNGAVAVVRTFVAVAGIAVSLAPRRPGRAGSSRRSASWYLAIVHNRSESRLRYGPTSEGSGAAARANRSARRTTVRARSSHAAVTLPPGTTNSAGGWKRSSSSSIRASRRSTISWLTAVTPGSSRALFSGAVASSAISTHRSRISGTSDRSSSPIACTRARPSTAWASSTVPYAAGSSESFATRPPNSSPVVPSSPVLV